MLSFSCRNVYNLCVAHPEPFADLLYEETKQFLKAHVENMMVTRVNPAGGDADGGEQPDLIKRYYDAWSEYSEGIKYLHNLYSYLNMQHIKKQKISDADVVYGNLTTETYEQMEIGELGLDIWRTKMIEPLHNELVKHILEGIKADRIGNPGLDDERVKVISGVMHSFVDVQAYNKTGPLKIYQWLFECPLLLASGKYYATEASALLQRCTVSEYIEEVIKILDDENKRAKKLLHARYASKWTN